jgi:putative heme-binding domain-containing protein
MIRRAAQLARSPAVQTMLAELVRDARTPDDAFQAALMAISEARLKEVPNAWIETLAWRTRNDHGPTIDETLACIRKLKTPAAKAKALNDGLMSVANDPSLARKIRVMALAAVAGNAGAIEPELFDKVYASLGAEQPAEDRLDAAEAVAQVTLDKNQRLRLCKAIQQAGPLEVERLLPVFAKSPDDEVGSALIAALRASAARDNLRAEMLKPIIDAHGKTVKEAAAELLADVTKDSLQQRAELDALMTGLLPGDIRRGQLIFHSAKTACFACHAIGYVGGRTGPDLSSIGKIRSDRDLLESIVFPSLSLVRSYEPVLIITKDGKSHNGLIRTETADEVFLTTGPNEEARIATADIEDRQASKVSIMPTGLDKQLTRQELADLLAFLKSRKQ